MDILPNRAVDGACAPNEYCFGGRDYTADVFREKVSCIKKLEFAPLEDLEELLEWLSMRVFRLIQIIHNLNDIRRRAGFGAVLTGPDGQTRFYADKLELRAFWLEHGRNASLINGTAECESCAGVDINPLPAGTLRVELTVSMPRGKPTANLYLAEYSSGAQAGS